MKQVGNGIYLEIFLPPEGAEHDSVSHRRMSWCAGVLATAACVS